MGATMNDLIQTKYDALHSETAQQIKLLNQKVQRLEEEQTRLITALKEWVMTK